MTTRESLRRTAERAGWEINADMALHSFEDEWSRPAELAPGSKLARMVALVDWSPRERIYVGYTAAGGVWTAHLWGPENQSLVTGLHCSAAKTATGRGKRETVTRWMQERITHGAV